MTRPRSQLVSLEATPYYHCISRCVRRAFLCGKDRYTRKCFNHRRTWIVQRLKLLCEVFAIDVAAYALMSNHYHLIIHIDRGRALRWSQEEVLDRWLRLYKGPALIQRYRNGEVLRAAELAVVDDIIEEWRSRLYSVSWYMACLNEFIARKANIEDECKGRFWEGRFKSQALLDDTAVLSSMAYVDLNPVRAGMTESLEQSDFTSIQQRLREISGTQQAKVPRLQPFSEGCSGQEASTLLPYHLKDYVELLDWTGRHIRQNKKGYIAKTVPSILEQIGLNDSQWRFLALDIQKRSILTLHGFERVATEERRLAKRKAA